ncbi:MAG: putative methyltransferase mtx subunit X [Candidatus Methanofastidiosum methylothiophilum]|uniref:Putative methyltransferase mtx subunit X n=1 Tax=Candidatus Methanofastidiosum methylothiophilum TaxID=1705564 RepID=A0A150J047_9EURY|nr:MAG: putative methyltransferase mtx subunit X [Candidatus Methanofastidiosum methylthiophilus]KYC48138.1 MAG: putative methyltransferase mtx subunit X [Candidatus Methanofastidiosum methylthiophilus]KYC50623.1 MAG: putative methyltransferase mtx subunit X [Candidatus Methanofastidiosum methylthiophilus]
MLSIIKNRINPDLIVGLGASENIDKIEDAANSVDFCNVKVFGSSSKILSSLRKGEIDAVVRGTLSSSDFLKEVKNNFKIDKIYRIGLLGTYDKKYFFFAPLGIDEGEDLKEKEMFIEYAKDLLKRFKVEPKISVLSGGRAKDLGRSKRVDKSILDAEALAEKYGIEHSQILIENAIKYSNFILAPDGISGNLVYRTLIHLGGGSSHGALYYPLAMDGTIIVDTSRAAPKEEYISSIALANAIKNY